MFGNPSSAPNAGVHTTQQRLVLKIRRQGSIRGSRRSATAGCPGIIRISVSQKFRRRVLSHISADHKFLWHHEMSVSLSNFEKKYCDCVTLSQRRLVVLEHWIDDQVWLFDYFWCNLLSGKRYKKVLRAGISIFVAVLGCKTECHLYANSVKLGYFD
jgi:hypothetical protein